MKKLGFGLMRLPKKGPFTDIEQTKKNGGYVSGCRVHLF